MLILSRLRNYTRSGATGRWREAGFLISAKEIATMFAKVTAKLQVTFPARLLEELAVKPGGRIELQEGPGMATSATREDDKTTGWKVPRLAA